MDEQETTPAVLAGVQGAGGGAAVAEPGMTRAVLARELGVTAAQLKEWQAQLAAAGSAAVVAARQAEAEELARLRRDNGRLREELEVMRKASAFFAQWATKT